MDKKHCSGCNDNFYNGNNPHGIKECWMLKSAKVIWRKKVPMNQRPPWSQAAIQVPKCYKQSGYIFVPPSVNW